MTLLECCRKLWVIRTLTLALDKTLTLAAGHTQLVSREVKGPGWAWTVISLPPCLFFCLTLFLTLSPPQCSSSGGWLLIAGRCRKAWPGSECLWGRHREKLVCSSTVTHTLPLETAHPCRTPTSPQDCPVMATLVSIWVWQCKISTDL